jgi:hypothetical protein
MTYIGNGMSAFKTKGFSGFNLDRNLYVQCEKCGEYVSMHPRNKEICSCGNITKDIDSGVLKCETGFKTIRVFEAKPKSVLSRFSQI